MLFIKLKLGDIMAEFFKEMTVGNVFLVYHMFGGMILARFFGLWRRLNPILMVLVVAILWEVLELYLNNGIGGYSGGLTGYIADTIGDVLGAVIMAWVVVD